MAGAMRKVGEYLGLVEQADFDEDYDETGSFDGGQEVAPAAPERRAPVVRAVSRIEEAPKARQQAAASALARIETVTPRTYNDARTVGEHYRSGVPVIMNLSEISDDDAKRLVDFAAGLVFAVHGSINRVTAKVFLLSPSNVVVTDEDKARIAAGGFYNHA